MVADVKPTFIPIGKATESAERSLWKCLIFLVRAIDGPGCNIKQCQIAVLVISLWF